MLGDPYRQETRSPEQLYFSIDEQYKFDTSRSPKLSYYYFDITQYATKISIKDILLKDVKFNVIDILFTAEEGNYLLVLETSGGKYFTDNYKNIKKLV